MPLQQYVLFRSQSTARGKKELNMPYTEGVTGKDIPKGPKFQLSLKIYQLSPVTESTVRQGYSNMSDARTVSCEEANINGGSATPTDAATRPIIPLKEKTQTLLETVVDTAARSAPTQSNILGTPKEIAPADNQGGYADGVSWYNLMTAKASQQAM